MTQLDELEKLHDLKEKGIISETEFEVQKSTLLKGNTNQGTGEMVPMKEAYISYWKKSFVWSGRSTRAEYWWPYLVNLLINIATAVVGTVIPFLGFAYILFAIANIFPGLAVYVRRMHDVNKSAWFAFTPVWLMLILMIFGMGAEGDIGAVRGTILILTGIAFCVISIVLLVYTCLSGTKGRNKYGEAR